MELWTSKSGTLLATLNERITTSVPLPIDNAYTPTLTIISGSLPAGLRLENYDIKGTPFEVERSKTSTFVIRAVYNGILQDRTFSITVEGSDAPVWITNPDLLPIGPNNSFFILDSEPVNFQLQAIDPDVPAGDTVEYSLKPKDGVLPPGIQLTRDGRLVGIVEPILALDKREGAGYYDSNQYADTPYDFGILSSNGFDSFYYDSTFYDYADVTQSPRKLNRFFQFTVTASDGDTSVDRTFRIFVVGDDFLRSDNTILKIANGLFTADNTHVRTPIWITPSWLGVRRANNYITLFLDTIDPPTLTGKTVYSLMPGNPDGSNSVLPEGMIIDQNTGEIAGTIPYQPAITRDYKFTVRAQRFAIESNLAYINGFFYEDTLPGKTSFKIIKLSKDLSDGIDDLRELVGRNISINGSDYVVDAVESVDPRYDIIKVDRPLKSKFDVLLSNNAFTGQDYVYVNRLAQSQREKLIKRFINFSDTEANQIQSIVPYIEWEIETYSGTDNIDINYDFLNEPQAGVGESFEDQLVRVFNYNGFVTEIISVTPNKIRFVAPLSSISRASGIKNVFSTKDSTHDLKFTLINDSRDRVTFDVSLQRNLVSGFNIGLALYYTEGFVEEIVVSDTDFNAPFKDKTFTLQVIGEVDSTITWNSPSELGSLNPNFISVLNVSASTTVSNSNLLYRLTGGRLPPGLELSYDGEIIGKIRQFATGDLIGLTSIDGGNLVLDNNTTTIDRDYVFTVEARDRYGFSASEKEFTIKINDPENKLYSNLNFVPMLKPEQRLLFRNFISNPDIFPSELIYRPNDPSFGLQKQIKILAYAGIETQSAAQFVAAVSQNHKRKRFNIGAIKTAVAKEPGTNEVLYEVVYIDLIDPTKPLSGQTNKSFITKNTNSITVDSIQYETKEDQFKTDAGVPTLKVGGIEFVDEQFFFLTRDGEEISVLPGEAGIVTRNGTIIDVVEESDSAPFKFRPKGDTIKTDNTAVKISNPNDTIKYISNIDNMRSRLRDLGTTERGFLPLWMRTAQESGIQELGYVLSIPLCYCKPGTAGQVALNIKNNGFDFKVLDIEVDRYVIDSTTGNSEDQYIAFANYQYNI